MVTQSVRLPDELARRLDEAAHSTRRSKSSFIVEALERLLEEREDLEIGLTRFRDPEAQWIEHDQVKRELDLD